MRVHAPTDLGEAYIGQDPTYETPMCPATKYYRTTSRAKLIALSKLTTPLFLDGEPGAPF